MRVEEEEEEMLRYAGQQDVTGTHCPLLTSFKQQNPLRLPQVVPVCVRACVFVYVN